MKAVVLDTNVLIDFLEKGASLGTDLAEFDRILVPAAVDGEFRAGIDVQTRVGRERERKFAEFLADASVDFVSLGPSESMKFSQVYRILKKNGTPIPINDVWIAAVALVRDASLFTYDNHFTHIPLLKMIRVVVTAGGRRVHVIL